MDCEFYRFGGEHMLEEERYHPRLFVRYPVFELPEPVQRFARRPRFVGKPREALLNLLPPYRRHANEFCGQVYLDRAKDLRRAELLASRIEAPSISGCW